MIPLSRSSLDRCRRAEHPVGVWLAPIKGVFLDYFERWADPTAEERLSVELEPGILWRSTTVEDKVHLGNWFGFYAEAHAPQERQEIVEGADTLIAPTEARRLDEIDAYPKVASFMIALSLETTSPLAAHLMLFEIEDTPERRHITHSGYRPIETVRLPAVNLQEPITQERADAVRPLYAAVVRAFEQPPEHGLRRALGAYRAAVSRLDFMNAIPILTCAAMEALTAAEKDAVVVERLSRRYASASCGKADFEDLYRLRHWYAHGGAAPHMRDPDTRVRALKDGLAVAKAVLREAILDDDLFAAASHGTKAVKKLLD